jgi:hypothetical protein
MRRLALAAAAESSAAAALSDWVGLAALAAAAYCRFDRSADCDRSG